MADNGGEYEANYKSALSFLKVALKEQAFDCLNRAYAQIPEDRKNGENVAYLDILDNLAILLIEKANKQQAAAFIEEGLSVKKDHSDLLFLRSLLLLDEQRYDEMLETLLHFLLSLAEDDVSLYNYKYIHEGALKEVYDNLLPRAYRYTMQHEAILDIVHRLCETTKNAWLAKAREIMAGVDRLRPTLEN